MPPDRTTYAAHFLSQHIKVHCKRYAPLEFNPASLVAAKQVKAESPIAEATRPSHRDALILTDQNAHALGFRESFLYAPEFVSIYRRFQTPCACASGVDLAEGPVFRCSRFLPINLELVFLSAPDSLFRHFGSRPFRNFIEGRSEVRGPAFDTCCPSRAAPR